MTNIDTFADVDTLLRFRLSGMRYATKYLCIFPTGDISKCEYWGGGGRFVCVCGGGGRGLSSHF